MKAEIREECDGCGFPNIECVSYSNGERWLCDLCNGTYVGNALKYPNQYGSDERHILLSMCFIGNTILAKLKQMTFNDDEEE